MKRRKVSEENEDWLKNFGEIMRRNTAPANQNTRGLELLRRGAKALQNDLGGDGQADFESVLRRQRDIHAHAEGFGKGLDDGKPKP